MPILAASSGIVIPGWPWTNESASRARVPLPLRRPARRLAGRPALPAALLAALPAALGVALEAPVLARLTEPRGRPGPRRLVVVVATAPAALDPPTPESAAAADSRRLY